MNALKVFAAYVVGSYLVNWWVLNHWFVLGLFQREPGHSEKAAMLLFSPITLPIECFIAFVQVAVRICECLV